jgi:hypothetical protein
MEQTSQALFVLLAEENVRNVIRSSMAASPSTGTWLFLIRLGMHDKMILISVLLRLASFQFGEMLILIQPCHVEFMRLLRHTLIALNQAEARSPGLMHWQWLRCAHTWHSFTERVCSSLASIDHWHFFSGLSRLVDLRINRKTNLMWQQIPFRLANILKWARGLRQEKVEM